MLRITATGIGIENTPGSKPWVVLSAEGQQRVLAFRCNPESAKTVIVAQQLAALGQMAPRPLAHELAVVAAVALGAAPMYAVITQRVGEVFHAQTVFAVPGMPNFRLDCRPTDAIAITYFAKIPLYVSDELLLSDGVDPAQLGIELVGGEGAGGAALADGLGDAMDHMADFKQFIKPENLAGGVDE